MQDYWKQYWANRENGMHRIGQEPFFEKKARELMLHLGDQGGSLLEFGCGSGDLLVYYAACFSSVVACDYSLTVLEKAKGRCQSFGVVNCNLIEADDKGIWNKLLEQKFDRILSASVLQYLDRGQVENLIQEAGRRLRDGGRIVLADIPDSRIFCLWQIGAYSNSNINKKLGLINFATSFAKLSLLRMARRIRGLPADEIGYTYQPSFIAKVANQNGLSTEIVSSVYYEGRFHAILTKQLCHING